MNIHPLFVHFPIGILCLYVFFELLSATRFEKSIKAFEFRALLAVFGSLSAILTLSTGELAEEAIKPSQALHQVIETHSMFATITTAIFIVLAASYVVVWISQKYDHVLSVRLGKLVSLWVLAKSIANILQKKPIRIALALIGLVTITITGGLGASIVYGPNVDPFVTIIYNLFF